MSVDRLLMDALRPLGYPVGKAKYNQVADTYIAFVEYNQAPRLNADDEEIVTKRFYQVDVFSNGNYNQLVKDLKSAMKQAGFKRMFESETYDEDFKKYRKILRFNYENRIGDGMNGY